MTGPTRRTVALSLAAAGLAAPMAGARQNALPAGWSRAPSLPIRVQEIYPALMDGRIHVVGGLSPDVEAGRLNISDRAFSWAPGEAEWSELPRLPLPVHHPYCLAREGKLFAIGGFTARRGGRWSMSEIVHVYDPEISGWRLGPAMPQPLAETVAVNHQGTIHLVTGRRPAGFENTEWPHHADITAHIALAPGSDSWVTLPPAPSARNSAAGVMLDGRIHVIGGRTVSGGNTPVHEVYDIEGARWTTAAPLPEPSEGPRGAGGLAAAVLHGTIHVFGGEWFDAAGGGVYSQVWAFDPDEDRWREASRMPTPRHGLGAVTIGDAIYTIGGGAQAGGGETTGLVEVFRP